MHKVLVISNQSLNAYGIEEEFSRYEWASEHINMRSLLEQGSSITQAFQNITVIIDNDFIKNFGNHFVQIGSLLDKSSKHSSIFLLFEDIYDPTFAPWLSHTKRMFQSINRKLNFENAIKEIIGISFQPVPITYFVSPMKN